MMVRVEMSFDSLEVLLLTDIDGEKLGSIFLAFLHVVLAKEVKHTL